MSRAEPSQVRRIVVSRPASDQPAYSLVGVAETVVAGAVYAAGVERVEHDRADAARAARRVTPAPPVPRAQPVVQVNSSGERCQYADLIRSIWTQDAEWLIGIAWRESRCTSDAKSPTGCWGILQLCVPLHLGIFRYVCPELTAELGNDVALNAECNIRAGWHLYTGAGRRPWAL